MTPRTLRSALSLVSFGAEKKASFRKKGPQWSKARERHITWLTQENLVGLGIGERLADGDWQSERVLKVYVKEKRSKSRIKISERIPDHILLPGTEEPVPLDVEAIGEPELHATARSGSAIVGTTGINGSLGCLVRDNARSGAYGLISNAHVLGLSNNTRKGTKIHTKMGVSIAKFDRAVPLKPQGRGVNLVDAAYAQLTSRSVGARTWQIGLVKGIQTQVSRLKTGRSQLQFYSPVRKSLITTIVRDTDFETHFNYGTLFSGEGKKDFDRLIKCDAGSIEGDSGAIVVNAANNFVVGLVIGGNHKMTCICRIGDVQRQLKVTVMTHANMTNSELRRFVIP